jgi:hypothetical protein
MPQKLAFNYIGRWQTKANMDAVQSQSSNSHHRGL